MLIRKRRKLRDGGSCQHLGVVGEIGIYQQPWGRTRPNNRPGCCIRHPNRGRAPQSRLFPNPRTYSATSVLRFFVTCACASNHTRHSVPSSSTNHAVSVWDDVLKWRAASNACTPSFFMLTEIESQIEALFVFNRAAAEISAALGLPPFFPVSWRRHA